MDSLSLLAAQEHLPYDSKPLVYIGESKLELLKGEKGLFASVDIEENKPVVIYYGDRVEHEDIYQLHETDKQEYNKIMAYLRGNGKGLVVNGLAAKEEKNPNLLGVYVNDRWSLPKITTDNLRSAKAKREYNKYISMMQKTNLRVVETLDYPVYYSKRDIKKDEELYVPYGIGFWLTKHGIGPADLHDLRNSLSYHI